MKVKAAEFIIMLLAEEEIRHEDTQLNYTSFCYEGYINRLWRASCYFGGVFVFVIIII
jgi:hypothetical protein